MAERLVELKDAVDKKCPTTRMDTLIVSELVKTR